MKITVEAVTEKTAWERFVAKHSEANFLASWNWGEFHQRLGKAIFYRGYYSDEKLIGICLLVKEEAKRGHYLTVAGGPLLDWNNSALVEVWRDDIQEIAKREKCSFVRVRPQLLHTNHNQNRFQRLGFVPAPMHLTADLTLELDLTKSLDELLKDMRKNTRYEIRKSIKQRITTEISSDPGEVKEFYRHQLALAKKHGFVPFSYEFLLSQFRVFAQDDQVLLIHALKGSELLASAFVMYYREEAVYHYGVSTEYNRRLPGSYASLWRAIQEAKERGLKRFNFWGIAPKGAKNHRFSGVSIFKRGFGGEEVHFLKAHDLPVSRFYWLVHYFEKFRAKARNLD